MKNRFRKSDRVVFINKRLHCTGPWYYPEFGTIGKVIQSTDENELIGVEWPESSLKNTEIHSKIHYCSIFDVILVNEVPGFLLKHMIKRDLIKLLFKTLFIFKED